MRTLSHRGDTTLLISVEIKTKFQLLCLTIFSLKKCLPICNISELYSLYGGYNLSFTVQTYFWRISLFWGFFEEEYSHSLQKYAQKKSCMLTEEKYSSLLIQVTTSVQWARLYVNTACTACITGPNNCTVTLYLNIGPNKFTVRHYVNTGPKKCAVIIYVNTGPIKRTVTLYVNSWPKKC